MIHIILCVSGAVSAGYIVQQILYWREMHALVPLRYDVCSGEDLIISLAVAGLVAALL